VVVFPFEKRRSLYLPPDAHACFTREISRRLPHEDWRGAIKSALMNQSVIAGIGNVYSDEILYQAGVHPRTPAAELKEKKLREIHRVMRRVLSVAWRKGGDGRKVPRTWLLPARGGPGPCPRCGGQLESAKVSGRTAWFCPRCQS
jgi:formamidopyrimidine-DNA glycosylase